MQRHVKKLHKQEYSYLSLRELGSAWGVDVEILPLFIADTVGKYRTAWA